MSGKTEMRGAEGGVGVGEGVGRSDTAAPVQPALAAGQVWGRARDKRVADYDRYIAEVTASEVEFHHLVPGALPFVDWTTPKDFRAWIARTGAEVRG